MLSIPGNTAELTLVFEDPSMRLFTVSARVMSSSFPALPLWLLCTIETGMNLSPQFPAMLRDLSL